MLEQVTKGKNYSKEKILQANKHKQGEDIISIIFAGEYFLRIAVRCQEVLGESRLVLFIVLNVNFVTLSRF